MGRLIDDIFRPAFHNPLLAAQHDGAVFAVPSKRLAFTSDSYVVQPLFFSGGDIGSLAVNGTMNDLAMCGARPRYLSANFILEEGLLLETLRRVVSSMQSAAQSADVQIVTGDTKVVERGRGDGLLISMSGVGFLEHDLEIQPASVRVGDAVLLSGDLGRHGIAVLAARDGLEFEGVLPSDCAALFEPVQALLAGGIEIHCLRDLTRGGLSAALVEIGTAARVRTHIEESAILVEEPVRGACELLGLDPLLVANEGRFIVYVPAGQAYDAAAILRRFAVSSTVCRIGTVTEGSDGQVTMLTTLGSRRIIDLPSGEQLPRIC